MLQRKGAHKATTKGCTLGYNVKQQRKGAYNVTQMIVYTTEVAKLGGG